MEEQTDAISIRRSAISTTSTRRSERKTITFVDSPSVNLSDNEESTSASGHHSSLRRIHIELSKERKAVKTELSKVCQEFNLLIFMVYVQLCINWFLLGIQWLPYKVIVPEIDCNIDSLKTTKWTFYERRNITSPKDNKFVPGCVYYDFDYYQFAQLSYKEAEKIIKKMKTKPAIYKCKKYVIEHDVPKEISPIREFNAFCIKKSYMSPSVYSQYGMIACAFFAGVLTDIYGRRPLCIIFSITATLSAVALASSANFVMYSMAKFMLSGSLISLNIPLVIIYSELFRHRWRTANTIIAFVFFVIGYTLTNTVNIHNIVEVWRLKHAAFSLVTLILVFGATMVTVESPRFLIKQKQFKKVWDCLKELGVEEIKPGVQDHEITKPSLKYQMKILTKVYFLHRMYTVLILSAVAVIYTYLLMNIKLTLLLPSDENHQFKLACVEVLLIIATGIASINFSKRVLVCCYYVLLGFCLLVNMLSEDSSLRIVSLQTGYIFTLQIFILNYTYLIEVFPTSHRATSLGLYFSVIHIPQVVVAMFKDQLEIYNEIPFFSGFYCGLCVICVLITLVSPDSGVELPDRKQDLFIRMKLSHSTSYHSY